MIERVKRLVPFVGKERVTRVEDQIVAHATRLFGEGGFLAYYQKGSWLNRVQAVTKNGEEFFIVSLTSRIGSGNEDIRSLTIESGDSVSDYSRLASKTVVVRFERYKGRFDLVHLDSKKNIKEISKRGTVSFPNVWMPLDEHESFVASFLLSELDQQATIERSGKILTEIKAAPMAIKWLGRRRRGRSLNYWVKILNQ